MKQPLSEKLIGYFLLMPAIISAIAFIFSDLLDIGGNSSIMADITNENHSGLAIFIGLLALAGVYMLKSNIRYTERSSLRKLIAFLSESEPSLTAHSTTEELSSEVRANTQPDKEENSGIN